MPEQLLLGNLADIGASELQKNMKKTCSKRSACFYFGFEKLL